MSVSEPKPAAEILGRLCAKTVDPSMPGGGGGIDVLSSHDISAAMTGIQRGPALLCRLKYAGDTSCHAELVRIIEARIRKKASAEKWNEKNSDWLQGMAELAVLELLPATCPRCKGRNDRQVLVLTPKRAWINCPSCSGTGRHSLRQAARAREVGIPWESWRRTWRARQDWVRTTLITWEHQAIMSMIRQLRRAE